MELRDIKRAAKERIEIVDFNEGELETVSCCSHCVKFGFMVPLKNRICPDNEPIPVDHDQWLQCHECGLLVPVYELQKESSIKDVVETVDNPFDIGKSFLGIDSRKLSKKKRKQQDYDYINDPDLKRELASGQTQLISYSES